MGEEKEKQAINGKRTRDMEKEAEEENEEALLCGARMLCVCFLFAPSGTLPALSNVLQPCVVYTVAKPTPRCVTSRTCSVA